MGYDIILFHVGIIAFYLALETRFRIKFGMTTGRITIIVIKIKVFVWLYLLFGGPINISSTFLGIPIAVPSMTIIIKGVSIHAINNAPRFRFPVLEAGFTSK